MAVYIVTGPDGSEYEVNAPDGAEDSEIIAYAQQQFSQPKKNEGFGASMEQQIQNIPRAAGLTARSVIEGAANIPAMVTDPIIGLANQFLPDKYKQSGASQAGQALSNKLGLPSPQTTFEKVTGKAGEMLTGVAGFAGGAGAMSGLLGPGAAKETLSVLSSQPLQQMGGAVGGGAAGEYVKETGGGPASQFAASVGGALLGAGAASLGQKLYSSINSAVKSRGGSAEEKLAEILSENGLKLSDIPRLDKDKIVAEMKRAASVGDDIRPEVVRRIADYSAVGATPTRGTTTLDPALVTQEKNLAKIGMQSPDPDMQALGRIQNENNATIIDNLNRLGAGNSFADDAVSAGESVMRPIAAKAARSREIQKSLYDKARDSAGRGIELDRDQFVYDAYQKLADDNKGAYLPESIKSILEEIRSGTTTMGGKEFKVPFNVDVIDNLETTLANEMRKADGNTKRALSIVKNSLVRTEPLAGGGASAVSKESLDAFRKARAYSRARFDWMESSPGVKAALDGVPADNFVKDYIISNTSKASSGDVAKLMATVRKDPVALQTAREALMTHLKSVTLAGRADDLGSASGLMLTKEIKKIGDRKLSLFMSPEEINKLKAVARVASYEQVQPRGSAVNNSNTASSLAGMLDKIVGSKLINKLPGSSIVAPQISGYLQPAVQGSIARQALNPMAQITSKQAPQGLITPAMLGPMGLLSADTAGNRQ